MLSPLGPLRTTVPVQHVFERGVPFFFAHGASDPESSVVSRIFWERHVVRDDFDNPRFGNAVMEFLAECEVLFGRVACVIKDDERRRLTDDERRFQKALCTFDGIASVEGGIVCHVTML